MCVCSEIFMKGYKIDDPEEIRTKILACDEKYCTLNFLENLSKFLPNPEQVCPIEQNLPRHCIVDLVFSFPFRLVN